MVISKTIQLFFFFYLPCLLLFAWPRIFFLFFFLHIWTHHIASPGLAKFLLLSQRTLHFYSYKRFENHLLWLFYKYEMFDFTIIRLPRDICILHLEIFIIFYYILTLFKEIYVIYIINLFFLRYLYERRKNFWHFLIYLCNTHIFILFLFHFPCKYMIFYPIYFIMMFLLILITRLFIFCLS